MSSPILGLRTCIYMVDNLPEAIEWYNKAFNTEPYFNEPFYVGYNIGGYELGLQPDSNGGKDKTKNIRTYWGVYDVKAVYQHFLSMGATVVEEPQEVGSEIVVAGVADPWNNVVGFIYNPHFKLP